MRTVPRRSRYVLCVDHRGYPASLELRKIYRTVPDAPAARKGLIRVIDESGQGYLYPSDWFLPIELPKGARPSRLFRLAS